MSDSDPTVAKTSTVGTPAPPVPHAAAELGAEVTRDRMGVRFGDAHRHSERVHAVRGAPSGGRLRRRVAMATLGVAVVVGLVIAAMGPSWRQMLILATAVAVIGPFAWSALRRTLDIFEPLPWALVAMGLIFVVRPIVDIQAGYAFRGILDLKPQFDTAVAAGLIATVALVVGYRLPVVARVARRLPNPPETGHPGRIVVGGFALLVLGLLGLIAYAARAGSSVVDLVTSGFPASASVSTAYFYLAPFMAFPALLLLLQRTFIRRAAWPRVLIAIAVLGLAAVLAPASQRLWLLLLVAPFALYPMLRAGYRPRLILVIIGLLVTVPAVVAMRDLQPGDGLDVLSDSILRVASDPAGTYYGFAAGPDTEMFDGLILGMQLVPDQLEFQPLSSLTSVLFHPVPRELWPDKPNPLDGQINLILFPDLRPGDASVAHSVVGNFFYDSGMFGVALGMLAVGAGMQLLYSYYLAHRDSDQVRVVYASALPLVIVLFRGNLPDTLARALFTVAPLVVVFAVAGARTRFGPAPIALPVRPSR